MRKKPFFLFLLLALVLSGCADDQYSIERKFWYALRDAGKIFSNLEASPPNQVERVVKHLDGLAAKYPKMRLAVESDFTIARLYIAKKDYQTGRMRLNTILKKYRDSKQTCAEAVFLIGNSYELEDRWDLALRHYKILMHDYYLTSRGMDIPMYIASRYKVNYEPDKMMDALQEAIAHYRDLAKRYPGSRLEFVSYSLITNCYAAMKDWQQVIATLNTMERLYKSKMDVSGLLLNKAVIYKRELKDTENAKKALQQIVKDYPKQKNARVAEAMLKVIDK